MDTNRRTFLALAGLAPVALLASRAAQAAEPACYDPASLPLSQKNRRRSIGYVEVSGNPAKHCSTCAFFKAGQPAGCGTCLILSNGPVSAGAYCNSYAPKAD